MKNAYTATESNFVELTDENFDALFGSDENENDTDWMDVFFGEFTYTEEKQEVFKTKGRQYIYVKCKKCKGAGTLDAYSHICGGRCFRCGGSGKEKKFGKF